MAEVKDLEKRIDKLKGEVAAKRKASGDRASLRETVKKLKRAQRRKKALQTRAAFIEAKGKKKVKKAEGAAS